MGLSIFHGFFWNRKRASAPGAIAVTFTVVGSGTAQQRQSRGGRYRNLPSWRPIRKSGRGSLVVRFTVAGEGRHIATASGSVGFTATVTGAGHRLAGSSSRLDFAISLTGAGTGDHFTERRQRMEDELLLAGVL